MQREKLYKYSAIIGLFVLGVLIFALPLTIERNLAQQLDQSEKQIAIVADELRQIVKFQERLSAILTNQHSTENSESRSAEQPPLMLSTYEINVYMAELDAKLKKLDQLRHRQISLIDQSEAARKRYRLYDATRLSGISAILIVTLWGSINWLIAQRIPGKNPGIH